MSVLTGQVVAIHTNRADVYLAEIGEVRAFQVKATLKKAGTTVLTGDQVYVTQPDRGDGWIVDVLPRRNELARPKIANVDGVLVVQSLTRPALDTEQLDRYLTRAALAELPVALVLTKSDIVDSNELKAETVSLYQALGYTVFVPNFVIPADYQTLVASLGPLSQASSATWVLAGVSGAGKSSLLNKIDPSLKLQEGELSEKLERGQHTTRHVSLLHVSEELWVADTPGFSRLSFEDTTPLHLEAAWPEFSPYRSQCAFANCLHADEADCSVQAAIERGDITEARYAHYLTFLAETQTGELDRQARSDKSEYGTKQLQRKGGGQQTRVRLDERLRDSSRKHHRQALTQQYHGHTTYDDDFDDAPV